MAISDVHARLQSTLPARIADFGRGAGWSSIGMAQAYLNARVDGFDLDVPSIELAASWYNRLGKRAYANPLIDPIAGYPV